MKTAFLSSCRFNPGHFSHLLANYKLLAEDGYDVSFVCHARYSDFSSIVKSKKLSFYNCFRRLNKDSIYIIWAPSVMALLHSFLVATLTRSQVIYIYHEPFTSFGSFRRAGFSNVKVLKIWLVSFISSLICLMSKLVILPSANSHSTFKLSWLRFLNHRKINLMFDDEVIDNSGMDKRKYVSYIGTVAEDHAFLEFIKLVELVCNNNLLPNVTFLVCTKSQVPNECSSAVERCVGQGRLKVVSGNVMTNEEINYFYAQSFIVWNAYKRSMQSGVLPKAYMFGVPVITSLSGSSEYFVSDSTGLAISSDYKLDDFVVAISSILDSFPKYSLCARAYFLENFYYKSLSGKFLKGLNSSWTKK